MCVVSVVFDYFDSAGNRRQPFGIGGPPAQPPEPLPWTRPVFDDFKEIIRRMEDLDRKLGQPDCTDPRKAEFLESIERRLRALEEKAAAK